MYTNAQFGSSRLKVLSLVLLGVFPVMAEAALAGRFQFVAGDVRIVAIDGKERVAQKGQEVNEGETVLTATSSSAQLKMVDGGVLALRPGTQLKVVTYAFNGTEDGSESAALSLLKGGLRAITGLIGNTHKDKYKFETPTGTIGIRGTDHEPVVVLAPPPGMKADNPPGTYDRVNVGATTLTTKNGTTLIGPNQVGFAASLNQSPVLLPKLPNLYQATPAPVSKQEAKAEQKQAAATSSAQPESSQPSAGESSGTDAASIPVKAVVPPALTGTDDSGNQLDISKQTLNDKNGQSLSLPNTPETLRMPKNDGLELIASYPATDPNNGNLFPFYFPMGGAGLALSRDAAGNLTSATDNGTAGTDSGKGGGFHGSLTQSGSTLTDLGGSSANGLAWGRWQGGQVTQSSQYFGQDTSGNWGLGANNSSGVFVIGATQINNSALGSGSLHWLTGSSVPSYLMGVLTGTANYTLLGGTHPTDQLGQVGTLNSASLGVNFTTQVVNANVNFSIGSDTWDMQSGAMSLDGSQFSSTSLSCKQNCSSTVSLLKNNVAISSTPSPNTAFAFGNMNGVLTGQSLNGAGLQYTVQEMVPNAAANPTPPPTGLPPATVPPPATTFSPSLIQGVVGFSGTAQNINAPFRAVVMEDGWGFATNKSSLSSGLALDLSTAYHGSVTDGPQATDKVVDGPAGLTEFSGKAHGYTPLKATQTVPGFYEPGVKNTIKIGSAINSDIGSATIAGTTISWGRWEGGSVDIYSSDGSVKLGSIDNSNRSMHWITTSALSVSSFGLPVTGTASYTVVGNTNPTDFNGNIGKLGAVTLKADFTNAKVDAGINLSFNSSANTSNWNMTASNIPIGNDAGFNSDTMQNGTGGILHTASCSGASCGAQTIGYLNGHFFSGAQGAVMTYGMATGSTNGTATAAGSTFTPQNGVTGVVVMKR